VHPSFKLTSFEKLVNVFAFALELQLQHIVHVKECGLSIEADMKHECLHRQQHGSPSEIEDNSIYNSLFVRHSCTSGAAFDPYRNNIAASSEASACKQVMVLQQQNHKKNVHSWV